MIKAGLVVEGGGMRGVYSSGVPDFFIEKDLFFDDHVGNFTAKKAIGDDIVVKQRKTKK